MEPPELIKPETETNYCNELPVLEWTPVKHAKYFQIFIDEKIIDTVYVDPEALNDDGNYTYDFNEKEHLTNLKIKLCGAEVLDESHKMCPYSPVIKTEEGETIIQPYTWYIRAGHEFQYEPSREKRTFTYNDCIKPELTINNPTPGMEIQEGKLKIEGVASDDETEIVGIEVQFDAGEVIDIDLEKSYDPEKKEFSFEIDTSDLPVGKHTVTVYVTDSFGNVTQVKVPVEIKPTAPDPIDPKGEICNPTPKFIWTEIDGITMYHLQISTDSTFENINFNIPGVMGTSYEMMTPLDNWTTYFWRVRSQDGSFYSEWSEVAEFNVAAIPTTTLKSPPDGSTSVSPKPTFVWDPSPSGGNSYRIEFSYDDTFSTTFYSAEVTNTTTFSPPDPMPAGNLYWRVQVIQGSCESPWSDPWLLIVDTICIPTVVPDICYPEIYCDTTLTISWDATCKNYLAGYYVEYSDNPEFSEASGNVYRTYTGRKELEFVTTKRPENGLFDLEVEGTMPINNGTYYFRISGSDGPNTGEWVGCEVEVKGILDKVTPDPIPNPFCITTPTVSWVDGTIAPGADRYRIQITETNPGPIGDLAFIESPGYLVNSSHDMEPNGTNDSFLTANDNTTFSVPPAYALSAGSTAAGKQYWYRVRGESGPVDDFCHSPWSDPIGFTIQDLGGAPTLLKPNPTPYFSCDSTPTFEWTGITLASNYRLEITTDSTNTTGDGSYVTTVFETEGNWLTYTLTAPQALPDGTYYWHVRGENPSCDGEYSVTWEYRVDRIEGVVINDDGPNYCAGATPTLTWDTTGLATYSPDPDFEFVVSVDNDGNWGNGIVTSSTFTEGTPGWSTTWQPILPPTIGTYNWRIGITDTAGNCTTWYTTERTFNMGDIDPVTIDLPAGMLCYTETIPAQPTFQWKSAKGATEYELVIDDDGTFDTASPPGAKDPNAVYGDVQNYLTIPNGGASPGDTLTYTLPPADALPNGVYYWKLLPKNFSCPGAWTTGSSFTIDIVKTPTTLAVNPAVSCDGLPTFSWTGDTNDEDYQIEVYNAASPPPAGSAINTWKTGGPATDQPPTPLPNGDYCYRVRAVSTNVVADPSDDCYSDWSACFNFSVSGITVKPTNLIPLSTDTYFCGTLPELRWTATPAPTNGYNIRVCTSLDGSNQCTGIMHETAFVTPASTTSYTLTIPLVDGVTYYWQVQPVNTTPDPDCLGPWSDETHFEADTIPTPTLVSLAADICTHTPTFQWNSVTGADKYIIRVGDGPVDGTGYVTGSVKTCDGIADPSTQWDSSVTVSPGCTAANFANGTWYWQVSAVDTVTGCETPPSAAETFNINLIDTAVVEQAPLSGDFCAFDGKMPGYIWANANTNATGYIIQVTGESGNWAPNPTFWFEQRINGITNTNFDQSAPGACTDTGTGPAFNCPVFVHGQHYWWRVTAITNECSNPIWSTPQDLITDVLDTPTPLTPINEICTERPTFTWSEVDRAVKYQIQVTWDILSNPAPTDFTKWTTNLHQQTLNNPAEINDIHNPSYDSAAWTHFYHDEYWWHVSAEDGLCNTDFDENWSATIHWVNRTVGDVPSGSKTPNAEVYCAQSTTDTPLLQWESCAKTHPAVNQRCDRYHVQVTTDFVAVNGGANAEIVDTINNVPAGITPVMSGAANIQFDFQNPPSVGPITLVDQISADNPPSSTYYWRVLGTNDASCGVNWTDWVEFNYDIITPPAIVEPVGGPGVIICNMRPTFKWTQIADAGGHIDNTINHSYKVEISTNCTAFAPIEAEYYAPTVTDTQWTPTNPLTNNQTYCWRVSAVDGADNAESPPRCKSAWTVSGQFQVKEIDGKPVGMKPCSALPTIEKVCDKNATFVFTHVGGVDEYVYELEKCINATIGGCDPNVDANWVAVGGEGGGGLIPDVAPGPITYTSTINLDTSGFYRWHVQGINPQCNGEFSDWCLFESSYLPPPTLDNPINDKYVCTFTFDEVGAPYEERFIWEEIPGATDYDIEIVRDTASTVSMGLNNYTCAAGSCVGQLGTDSDLIYVPPNGNRQYWWRVRANRPGDCAFGGEWSSWDSFIIGNVQAHGSHHATRKVTQTAPADEYYTCNNNTTFSYGTIYGATHYRVQISTDSSNWGPSQVAMLTSAHPTHSVSWGCGDPTCSGTYYWRVQPYNITSGCEGEWQEYRKFYFDQIDPVTMTLQGPNDMEILCNLNAANRDDTPVLSWSTVSTVHPTANIRYTLQVDNDDNNASELWNGNECDFHNIHGCTDNDIHPYYYWLHTSVTNQTTYDLALKGPITPDEGHRTYWRVTAQVIDIPGGYTGCTSGWTLPWQLYNRTPYNVAGSYDSWNFAGNDGLRWCGVEPTDNDSITLTWDNNTHFGGYTNHDVYNGYLWEVELYNHAGTTTYDSPGHNSAPSSTVGSLVWSTTAYPDPDAHWGADSITVNFNPVLPDETYYWRVRGYNTDCNLIEWSNYQKVIIETVEKPQLDAPIDYDYVCYDPNPTLYWNGSVPDAAPETGAIHYDLEIERKGNVVYQCCGSWHDVWAQSNITATSIVFPIDTIFTGSVGLPSNDKRISGYYRWRVRAYSGASNSNACRSGFTDWEYFRIFNKTLVPEHRTNCGTTICGHICGNCHGCGYFGCWHGVGGSCSVFPWKLWGDDSQQTVRWYAPPAANVFQIRIVEKVPDGPIVVGGDLDDIINNHPDELYVVGDTDWDTDSNNNPDTNRVKGNWENFVQYEFDLQDLVAAGKLPGATAYSPGGLQCGHYQLQVRATLIDCDQNDDGDCSDAGETITLPPDPADPMYSGCWTPWSAKNFTVLKADNPDDYNPRIHYNGTDIVHEEDSCERQPHIHWDDARCDRGSAPIDDAGFNRYRIQVSRNANFTNLFQQFYGPQGDMDIDNPSYDVQMNALPNIYGIENPAECKWYWVRMRQEHAYEGNPWGQVTYGCQANQSLAGIHNNSYPPWSDDGVTGKYKFRDMHTFDSEFVILDAPNTFAIQNNAGSNLLTGRNKSNGVVGPYSHVCTATPDFRWTWPCSVNRFNFQLAEDVDKDNVVAFAGTEPHYYERNSLGANVFWWTAAGNPLQHMHRYCWRVQPKIADPTSACDGPGQWGNSFCFDVVLLLEGPQKPVNQTPANNTNLCSTNLDVTWTDITGETEYHIEFCHNDPTCAAPFYTNNSVPANTTSYSITIPPERRWGKVYWQVSPHNPPCEGMWSDTTFVNVWYMDAPEPLAPLDCDASGNGNCDDFADCGAFAPVDSGLLLIWTSIKSSFSYDLEIYDNPTLAGAPVYTNNIFVPDVSDTVWTNPPDGSSPLTPCTTYSYRVKAKNGICADSAWSTTRQFRTESYPTSGQCGCVDSGTCNCATGP